MKEVKGYFEVVMRCGFIRRDLMAFETEKEASDWCDNSSWKWLDENDFEWDLDIEHRDDVRVFCEDSDFEDPYADYEEDLWPDPDAEWPEYESLGMEIGWC